MLFFHIDMLQIAQCCGLGNREHVLVAQSVDFQVMLETSGHTAG